MDRAATRLGELMGEGVDRADALNRVAEELGLSPEDRAALERAIIREEKDGDTGRTQTEEEIPGDRTPEGADLRPEGTGEAPTPALLEAVAAAERRNAGGDQGAGAGTGAEGRSDRVPEPGSAARTGGVEIPPPAEPWLPPVAQQFVDTGEIADPDLRRTLKYYARDIRVEAAQSRVLFIENDLGPEGVDRRRTWESGLFYRTLYDRLARGDAWRERNFKRILLRVMNKIEDDDFSLSRSPYQADVEREIRKAMLYLAAEETPGILLDVGDWDAAAEYYDSHQHRFDDDPEGADAMWAMVWGSEERYRQLVDYWLDWQVRREEQWRQEHPEWYSAEVVEDLWADDLVAVTDDGRILTPENIEAVNATAAANEARQIASEYGIPTAAEPGQQGDEPLLAILRQYGYAVDGLEGVDPGLVREVLERRKQALEAVSPEQQAEIDRRIVLERAEQLRANTERLQLESYKKQGRKATVMAVEDHFAEKYPDDPAKAQQMSRAVVAIWDAIGTTWARQNGRTLEDWYEGFILERGGTAMGGEGLNQSDNRLIALHKFSPHPWGWTFIRPNRAPSNRVFPTPVGMDRRLPCILQSMTSFPHTRGDGPSPNSTALSPASFSPHPWGWTYGFRARAQ